MKSLLTLLAIASFSVTATETYVVSGVTVNTHFDSADHEFHIKELVLNNCNITIASSNDSENQQVQISFADRKFEASGVNIKHKADGTCLLELENGQSLK